MVPPPSGTTPTPPAPAERSLQARRELAELVSRHIHCGFWEAPAATDGSPADLARATEEMCHRLFELVEAADGERILDVGCGMGGTLASLNDNLQGLSLVGVNIDGRELAWARRRMVPRAGNEVAFVEADGCATPLADGAFDLVMAIESILLFPSRARFFREAQRLVRRGGRLLVVDFVPRPSLRRWLAAWDLSLGRIFSLLYPQTNLRCSLDDYRRLAAANGFALERVRDWTSHTLPSYAAVRRVQRELGATGFKVRLLMLGNAVTEKLSRRGLVRYMALVFRDLRQVPG